MKKGHVTIYIVLLSSVETRKQMMSRYLSNPDYNYEKANKASVACGPLVKWAIAQVSYADMLQKVDPLREELRKNEDEMLKNKSKVSSKFVQMLNSRKLSTSAIEFFQNI